MSGETKFVNREEEREPDVVSIRSATGGEPVLRVDGDVRVAAGQASSVSFECTGCLEMEPGSRIDGSVRVRGDAKLGRDAAVAGLLSVQGDLDAEPGASAEALGVEGEVRAGGKVVARQVDARSGFEVSGPETGRGSE